MSLVNSELYLALLAAGAPEEKARAAAAEIEQLRQARMPLAALPLWRGEMLLLVMAGLLLGVLLCNVVSLFH